MYACGVSGERTCGGGVSLQGMSRKGVHLLSDKRCCRKGSAVALRDEQKTRGMMMANVRLTECQTLDGFLDEDVLFCRQIY